MTNTDNLLDIRNLEVAFPDEERNFNTVLKGINLSLRKGETLGIVGESGSGKSLTSLAIMGLLPSNARVQKGEILFGVPNKRVDLLHLKSEKEFQKIRGNRISMIFQEPMTSLNPVQRCGDQVAEVILLHRNCSKKEAHQSVIALFERVELPRPEEIFNSYPHQISGGQKQRVMIAMAVACEPELIIADEPTTALDVTVQKRILELLRELCSENNSGLIFITHDLGVVSEIADRVLVMYQGEVVEEGEVKTILNSPKESYTKALLACRPKLSNNPKRLPVVSDFLGDSAKRETPQKQQTSSHEIILIADNLGVHFPLKQSGKNAPAYLKAVDNVSFEVKLGETLGLVGESGCGKSTLGRTLVGLQEAHLGEAIYEEVQIAGRGIKFPSRFRRKIQIIFQDPYSSLNPGKTVEEALTEPLMVHGLVKSKSDRSKRIYDILDKVGLPSTAAKKYPHQFSGGQRQRICIARTLMVEPEFIICDESVSALDVSVQAKVLNLLNDLKEELNLTYIFISHDLSVVKYMSDRIIVMKHGKIEEMGVSELVYSNPKSAYTRSLIESIPQL
ncbi:ABC transporter ATP-binding protein [Cryomorphaceae bacterium 1068]|nr:ABC transporter ATP-binding protein [Cryomorphaceae bacterium 1068]